MLYLNSMYLHKGLLDFFHLFSSCYILTIWNMTLMLMLEACTLFLCVKMRIKK